jgi:hypothetical protein
VSLLDKIVVGIAVTVFVLAEPVIWAFRIWVERKERKERKE